LSQEISSRAPVVPVVQGTIQAKEAAPPETIGKTFSKHGLFAALLLACGILFFEPLHTLGSLALGSDYYSHTIVVPFLAGYLIFQERKRVFVGGKASLRAAAPLFLAGAVFSVLFAVGSPSSEHQRQLLLSIFAVVLFWQGSFALCYGGRAFRAALFPLSLLLLMVPLPMRIMNGFTHIIRVGSTYVSAAFISACGIPMYRDGFYIALPEIKIEVARECSGIHSIIALVIISLIVGHIAMRSAWKRGLLLLLTLPIVSVTNGLRIATLAVLAEYVDRNILNSSLHRDGGVLFFLLALSLLMLFAGVITGKRWSNTKDHVDGFRGKVEGSSRP
jgi:exosortase